MTKQNKTEYPLCDTLGVLVDRSGHTRVDYVLLCIALGPERTTEFDNWFYGSTMDEHGIYPWDVETFLEGRPNTD